MSIFVAQVTILHTFLSYRKGSPFYRPSWSTPIIPVRHANSVESQDLITTKVNDQRFASLFRNNKQTNRSAITSWHRRSKILLNRSPVGRRSKSHGSSCTFLCTIEWSDWLTHAWLTSPLDLLEGGGRIVWPRIDLSSFFYNVLVTMVFDKLLQEGTSFLVWDHAPVSCVLVPFRDSEALFVYISHHHAGLWGLP